MAPPGASIFGGFDLKNPNSLRRLAVALEYRLADGRDQSNAALSSLSPLQQATIDTAIQQMQLSPLLMEIVTPFLNAPRVGNAGLLAAGRNLEAYAVPQAYEPNAPEHANALAAWQTRQPLTATDTAVANHGEALTGTTTSIGQQGTGRTTRSGRENARSRVDNDNDDDEDDEDCPRGTKQRGLAQLKQEKSKEGTGKLSEEEFSKPKNKRGKNPLISQASEELSQSYTPPAPTPPPAQRRSTRLTRSQNSPQNTQPQVELTDEQITQIERDEQVARDLAKSEIGGLGPLGARPTVQERMRAEEQALEKPVRKSTRHRNCSPIPTSRTQFQTEAELAQERFDAQLARQVQREEGLGAGLGARRAGDVSEEDADDEESPRKRDPKTTPGKNAPKKRAGYRALSKGIDRIIAKIGVVDRQKMKISFDTERDDPDHPGRVIAGNRVNYDYLEAHTEPDWNSVEDMRALNTWRRQIFGRNFPPIRKAREVWVESEKKVVLDLMRRQLDRHRYIKWNRLANDYNEKMQGVVQRAGEKFVKQGNRKTEGIVEDRDAPWRSTSAIMGQSLPWAEYEALLENARPDANDSQGEEGDEVGSDGNPDSGDDEEIPDPNPGPRSEVTKRKPVTKSKAGTSSRVKKTRAKTGAKTKQIRGKKRKRVESEDEEEVEEIESEGDVVFREPLVASKKSRTGRQRSEEGGDDDEEEIFSPNLFRVLSTSAISSRKNMQNGITEEK